MTATAAISATIQQTWAKALPHGEHSSYSDLLIGFRSRLQVSNSSTVGPYTLFRATLQLDTLKESMASLRTSFASIPDAVITHELCAFLPSTDLTSLGQCSPHLIPLAAFAATSAVVPVARRRPARWSPFRPFANTFEQLYFQERLGRPRRRRLVACGWKHTIHVDASDGAVRACGANTNAWGQLVGQTGLGRASLKQQPRPLYLPSFLKTRVVHVSTGCYHSLFVDSAGGVYSCGMGDSGQLGRPLKDDRRDPSRLAQLGRSPETPTSWSPGRILALDGIRVVSAHGGMFHSAFVSQSGDAYVCGAGVSGQLGLGEGVTEADEPTRVPSLANVIHAGCGHSHTLFLREDGTVWSCGSVEGGRLGHGPRRRDARGGGEGAGGAGGGGDNDGEGGEGGEDGEGGEGGGGSDDGEDDGEGGGEGGGEGDAGDGEEASVFEPLQVVGLDFVPPIASVAAGGYHSLCLDSDGTAYYWGDGHTVSLDETDMPRIENMLPDDPSTPQALVIPERVVQVSGGGRHSAFVTISGHIYVMGSNRREQLGLPPLVRSAQQPMLASATAVGDVACGGWHTGIMFEVNRKPVLCGWNSDGQCGRPIPPRGSDTPRSLVRQGSQSLVDLAPQWPNE